MAIRSVALFVGAMASAIACGSRPAIPTAASSPSDPAANSPAHVTGVVRDLLQRPVAEAKISISEGLSAGAFALSDAGGRFALDAVASANGLIPLVVSKDGYLTATSRVRASADTIVYLRDVSLPNLEGRFTITFTADAACTQLPSALRVRSYPVVITQSTSTSALMRDESTFVMQLGRADFYDGHASTSVTAAHDAVRFNIFSWDAFNWWLEDDPIFERLTPVSYVSISGSGIGQLANDQRTIRAPWAGTFEYCAESNPPAMPNYAPTCAAARVECTSMNHELTLTQQ
jgi:carboxypeptidase family protein